MSRTSGPTPEAPQRAAAARCRLGLGACLALVGCSSGTSGPPEPPIDLGPSSVVLGTGELEYTPLEGEPSIPLTAGFQGGFHVYASFLAYGFASERLNLHVVTTWGESDAWSFPTDAWIRVHEFVDADGATALTAAGWPAQLANAQCSQGERVRIDMSVSDDFGRVAQDTRYFISEVPEQRRYPSCR